ncbi:MAG TPA: copper resistance protein CopC, partial [Isosphaeraceae bacterium]|nr:copper resistance protein CopC [Isosphaeraceae bacterium]
MSLLTQRRRARSRPPLRVEWLESRLLLSNDAASAFATTAQVSAASSNAPLSNNLTILSVDPASGSSSSTSPTAITFTFDRPIDPFSLGSDNDFDLLQVAPDGSTTSIYYNVNPSPTESLDGTGTQLTLTLNRQLGPGEYQVILRGSSSLAGTDGSMTASAGNDQVVTDFTIAAKGVTRADATDLGTIGSAAISTQGSLNFQTSPAAVALYKVTLADGHFWRLGLEVTAQRDGGSLDSALALFDAQGNPISTDEFGRTDDPFDPYLFAGLPPGTYYVGVSGTQNLPGNPGGYNLITGSPGSVSQNQPGGPFTLHLVADPEDAPPSVLTFTTTYGDPLGSSPTGLTLGFSSAIRLSSTVGSLSSTLSAGIEVVDQSGQVWPVLASGYSETSAQVSFLFADRLPEGQY